MRSRVLSTLLIDLVLLFGIGSPGVVAQEATPVLDPALFSTVITNPLFPLASIREEVLEGEDRDGDRAVTVRIEVVVLPETTTVAGIEVAVVEVKEYADGEITERTLDYYAQHVDGTVYYLGEDVDNYEDGEVVGHEGAWLAGEGENQAGVYMPAQVEVGQTFEQELAPGVAEDMSTVIAVDETVETPAGTFTGCIIVEDLDPLSGDTGEKAYCPGVGIARETSTGYVVELVSVDPMPEATPATPSGG